MKPTLFLATLSLIATSPAAFSKSELETLRDRCLEQERQIKALEEENIKLRSGAPKPATFQGGSTTISNPIPATPAPVSKPALATPAPAAAATTYTVKAGDNLVKIARKSGTTPEALAKANKLKISSVIIPGQKLKLPGTSPAPAIAAAAPASARDGEIHKVQPGETFFNIAKKHGVSTEALVAANPGLNPASLRPGQTIQLLAKPAPAPAAPSVTKNEISPPPATTAAPSPTPAAQAPTPEKKPVIRSVIIDGEMTYGEFAAKNGTDAERLNDLNGLDLSTATVLAKGSELYIPAQP